MKVSLIVPTYDRRRMLPLALKCYSALDWPERELVIVDDGTDPIEDMLAGLPNVIYARHRGDKLPIGTKRNLCCELASGDVICHADDDDWYAPERLYDQVTRLLDSGKAVTGYHSIYYWSELLCKAFLYDQGDLNRYAVGTSLCYTKDWWQEHRFPDKTYAEDNAFVFTARDEKQLATAPAEQMMVVRAHEHTTSDPRRIGYNSWPEVPPEKLNPQFFLDLAPAAQA